MKPCRTALFALAVFVPACSRPLTLSFVLGPVPARLTTATVMSDPSPGSAKIALIDVRGVIADAAAPGGLFAGPNPVDELVASLNQAARDSDVKAVVIRITSPGGTVTASDIMFEEVRAFRESTGKPVVASMGEVAASGGYYLALSADTIIAQPTSLTGSIGVIFPTVNVSEGLGMIGIHSRAVTSGPNKDMANPLEEPNEEHYHIIQTMVDEYYARFRARVETRRPSLKAEHTAEATDGRIVSGEQAFEWGLVDSLGGIREAFATAKHLAGVKSASLIKYREYPTRARTPYTESVAVPGPASRDVNLVQLNLSTDALVSGLGSQPYYIWLPPSP